MKQHIRSERYDALVREMNFVAKERGPKYAVQIALRLIVHLEARVNKLEGQTPNDKIEQPPTKPQEQIR